MVAMSSTGGAAAAWSGIGLAGGTWLAVRASPSDASSEMRIDWRKTGS
jgi:hypothetical protein